MFLRPVLATYQSRIADAEPNASVMDIALDVIVPSLIKSKITSAVLPKQVIDSKSVSIQARNDFAFDSWNSLADLAYVPHEIERTLKIRSKFRPTSNANKLLIQLPVATNHS